MRWLCFSLSCSMGFKVCYYCVIGNQRRAPEKIKPLYVFYWFYGNLVNRKGTTHSCGAGVCCPSLSVCVLGVSMDTSWRRGKKITLLTIAPGTFLFSKIMNRIDDLSWNASSLGLFSFHRACDGGIVEWAYWSSPTAMLFWLLLSKIEQ